MPKRTVKPARAAKRPAPAVARAPAAPARNNHKQQKIPATPVVVATPKRRSAATLRRKARIQAEAATPLVPLPPAPVMSDSKPRKNQAGLSSKELDQFRHLLLAKRRELLGDMSSMEREALQSGQGSNLSNLPVHMADLGTDNYEQEFTLGLVEKDRQLLREINHALAKVHDGTYGICEGTGKPIAKARLEIQPWARYSVEHARQLEKNMLMRY